MAAATEGYVQAHTDAVRAETQTTIAETLLRFERSNISQTPWIIGIMVGLSVAYVATTVSIALTLANPKPPHGSSPEPLESDCATRCDGPGYSLPGWNLGSIAARQRDTRRGFAHRRPWVPPSKTILDSEIHIVG